VWPVGAGSLSCLLLLASGGTAHAADPPSLDVYDDVQLSFDGQYRPRFLFHTGQDFLGKASEKREFFTHRARLGATIDFREKVAVTVRIQDVRHWGEEADTLGDFSADGLDAHEAFLVTRPADWLSLKVGRQEIVFDNARLVGNVDWVQRGRSFDAVRADISSDRVTLSTFYSKLIEKDASPDTANPALPANDADFAGAHVEVAITDAHKVAPSYLFRGDQETGNYRHTVGAYGAGKGSGFDYSLEAFFQTGHHADQNVKAFLGAVSGGYTYDAPTKPGVKLWGEVLTGDGTPEGTFDTLFATNHKFYGEMDVFLNIPVHTANLGLVDLGGRASVKPHEKLALNVDLHHLRSVESDAQGESMFGNELDVKLVYKPIEHLDVRLLGAAFFPGAAIRAPKQYPASQSVSTDGFGYLTLDAYF
jgi:hypothetical protein